MTWGWMNSALCPRTVKELNCFETTINLQRIQYKIQTIPHTESNIFSLEIRVFLWCTGK